MSTPSPTANDAAMDSRSAQKTLTEIQKQYGYVPNLYRVLSTAPEALSAYLGIQAHFEKTSFNATERNIILLAVSREHGCHYCIAAHSVVADMQNDPRATTDAIRDDKPIEDSRLEALRSLTQALVRRRGRAEEEVIAFIDAGYRPEQVLEILVGVALKTLSNFTNHLSQTPLEEVLVARVWGGDCG